MKFNNEKEELAYADFLNKEEEADLHNTRMIESMNLSHVKNKTKIRQTEAALKRWKKETTSNRKKLKEHQKQHGGLKYRTTAKERKWLMTA